MNDETLSPASDEQAFFPKLKATSAGNPTSANGRPIKRRASKACQCCRARKVRCNVVEHGAPCTNCRLDEVDCIVTESKRRKKHHLGPRPLDTITEQSSLYQRQHQHQHQHQHPRQHPHVNSLTAIDALANGSVNPVDLANAIIQSSNKQSTSIIDIDDNHSLQHRIPHPLFQPQSQKLNEPARRTNFVPPPLLNLMRCASISGDPRATRFHSPPAPSL